MLALEVINEKNVQKLLNMIYSFAHFLSNVSIATSTFFKLSLQLNRNHIWLNAFIILLLKRKIKQYQKMEKDQ